MKAHLALVEAQTQITERRTYLVRYWGSVVPYSVIRSNGFQVLSAVFKPGYVAVVVQKVL